MRSLATNIPPRPMGSEEAQNVSNTMRPFERQKARRRARMADNAGFSGNAAPAPAPGGGNVPSNYNA